MSNSLRTRNDTPLVFADSRKTDEFLEIEIGSEDVLSQLDGIMQKNVDDIGIQGRSRDALQSPVPEDGKEGYNHHHQPAFYEVEGGSKRQSAVFGACRQIVPQIISCEYDRHILPSQGNEKSN